MGCLFNAGILRSKETVLTGLHRLAASVAQLAETSGQMGVNHASGRAGSDNVLSILIE